MNSIDLIDYIKEKAKADGYDGIYSGECACTLEDMPLCGELCSDATLGWKHAADCNACGRDCGGEHGDEVGYFICCEQRKSEQ